VKWLLLLLLTSPALADWQLLELQEVRVNYERYRDGGRDPLFTDSAPKEALNLHVNTDLFRYFGWDSSVLSKTDQVQFHYVSLAMRLYIRVTDHLEIGVRHQSQHLLDTTYQHQRFPVSDSIEINLYLYRADLPREAAL
jgi:hypothetical protein